MGTEIERNLRTIFKRCVECNPSVVPTCPTCPNGQVCSLVPFDCNTCQHAICVANPSPAPPAAGPNVGAIAGGVIGGVFFVATVVYLVWRFWIKKRREQEDAEAEEWEEEDDIAQQKHRATMGFQAMHHDAASTRTRSSFASSILTRASNIIQIAYIPGVTNRDGTGSANNSMLVPPVPPIPAARGAVPRSPLSGNNEALFFRPGDLRDSQFSETSSLASMERDRNRNTQFSLSPSLARSSVASGVFRDDAAVEPMPATTVVRAAPRMVSVKSSTSGSPAESPASETPPSGFSTPKAIPVMVPGQAERPSTSSSLRSTASYGKPTPITLTKGKGRFPIRQVSDASTSASSISRHLPATSSPLAEREEDTSDEEEEHARARQSFINTSKEVVSPPQPVQSPFFDASEQPSSGGLKLSPYSQMSASVGTSVDGTPKRGGKGMGGLSAVIEEATRRASRVPSHEGLGGKRDASPFSDVHRTE